MKIYLERFKVYFTKLFYGKNTFRMLLQDYMKTMMLHFINNRSKMFNFETVNYWYYWLQLIQKL